MDPATRKFYGRLYALIYVVPGFIASAVIYCLLFLRMAALSPGEPWDLKVSGLLWVVVLTVLWAGAIGGLASVLARIGYQLFNLKRRIVRPSSPQNALLEAALLPLVSAKQAWTQVKLNPQLVDIGSVPMLAVQEHRGGKLWISTYTLEATPVDALQQLILHERAHLALRPGLQEWILCVILWAISWPVVQLLWPNPFWIAAAAAAHVSLWSWVNYLIRMRRERAADKLAAEACGSGEYAQHLAEYLAQFEPRGRGKLSRLRLDPLKTPHDQPKRGGSPRE